MKKLYISFPSKTFLIGEYAVLNSAPAILVNTFPRFYFKASLKHKLEKGIVFSNLNTNDSNTQTLKNPMDDTNYLTTNTDDESTNDSNANDTNTNEVNTDCSTANDSNAKKNKNFIKYTKMYFHADSPAGLWLKQHSHLQKVWDMEFYDPHKNKGGFGFSSAQFNLLYLLQQINLNEKTFKLTNKAQQINLNEKTFKPISKLEQVNLDAKNTINFNTIDLWQAYKNLHTERQKPSGADTVSQWSGQVCLFSSKPFSAKNMKWPFKDLDFLLLHTGHTFPTWRHLKNISSTQIKNFSEMSELSRQAVTAFKTKNTELFISSVKNYAKALETQNLTHKHSLAALKELLKLKNVVAGKGCGAMGVEVLALFFSPQDKKSIKQHLKKHFKTLTPIADTQCMSEGMQIHPSS